jgi:hypothetical protein
MNNLRFLTCVRNDNYSHGDTVSKAKGQDFAEKFDGLPGTDVLWKLKDRSVKNLRIKGVSYGEIARRNAGRGISQSQTT